jgi:hypothetical protein
MRSHLALQFVVLRSSRGQQVAGGVINAISLATLKIGNRCYRKSAL